MPDLRAAFFEAICAAPDDDVPRLVFADWLDDHGDADRADFIRLQIALARGSLQGPDAEAMRQRTDDLLNRHRREWLPDCQGVDWMVGFRRGFAEVVEIPPGNALAFAEKASRLFALAPLQEISLDPNPDFWTTFAEIPELRRICCLRIPHLDAAGFAVVLRSPYLTGLRTLDLSRSHVGPEGVAALLDSRLLGHVVSLSLAGLRDVQNYDWDETDWTAATVVNVGEGGALSLIASPQMAGVRRLDLSWNRLGARAAHALAHSPHLGGLAELRIAERGTVEHDGIDKSQREAVSPLTPDDIRTLRDRFGGVLRVWPDK